MANNIKQNLEKEVKFTINASLSQADLIDFIGKLGLALDHQDSQTDVYFDNDNYDIINLKRGLRLRYSSGKLKSLEFKSLFKGENGFAVEEVKLFDKNTLDYAGLENILVNRLDICNQELFSQNKKGVAVEKFLSGLNLVPAVTLKKDRQVYIDQEKKVEVCVDMIYGLGTFVEVEAIDSTSPLFDELITKFEKSGFASLDKTHAGYLDLMLSKNSKILSKSAFENKYLENPKWNVKPNEVQIFLHLTQ